MFAFLYTEDDGIVRPRGLRIHVRPKRRRRPKTLLSTLRHADRLSHSDLDRVPQREDILQPV